MRSKDIELMNKIKKFAEDFYIKEKCSPSTTVIEKIPPMIDS